MGERPRRATSASSTTGRGAKKEQIGKPMARSDLLISLVKASVGGDKTAVRTVVENIIADEKGKQHRVLADRLTRALHANGHNANHLLKPANEANSRGRDFLSEMTPQRQLEDLVLDNQTRKTVDKFIEEQHRTSILRAHGLDPRHRVMLVGPPGNGKTTLAEAIAEALILPFYVVRYEAIIGSYLGETAGRLKRVFDYIRSTPCVVFFDEFDAIGKERGDNRETGEIKRVVSSLLMNVDELPSYTVIIAASNHAELLDRAVWRRFQIRISLPKPTKNDLVKYFRRHYKNFDTDPGITPDKLANVLNPESFSEAEDFILDVRRQNALLEPDSDLKSVFADQIEEWKNRVTPAESSMRN